MAEGGQEVKSYSEILNSQDFFHYLKAIVAINFTGNGLKEYVIEKLHSFHEELLLKLYSKAQIERGSFCRNCTLQTIQPSSSCLCHKLKCEIKKRHTHFISWTDTDPSSWCTQPWEVAKCYLPMMYRKHSSVDELDFHGVISLMINLDAFGKRNKVVFNKARKMSNNVRHAPTHSCNEQTMNEVFHDMFNVLNCADGTQVAGAIEKLSMLKAEKDFQITHRETTELQKDTEKLFQTFLDYHRENEHTESFQKCMSDALSKNISAIDAVVTILKHREGNECRNSEHKQLKADLLVFNKESHGRIPLQPVFAVQDTQLLEYYVEQRMSRVDRGLERNQTPHPTISLQHILDQEPGRDIYLVSKAGGGKTVFCKWLAMLWCHAHDSRKTEGKYIADHKEYIEAMKKYAFFFLINLRNSKADSNVDFMIQHQIMEKLSHSASYTITDLQSVLHDENCLIVLDGLDEWTHPNPQLCQENDIPERNKRCGCTFLTTSRPWKFHMLNKLSSLTMHVELEGFDENASKEFITNALSKLGTEHPENRVEDFQKAITSQRLDRFKVIPLTLSFLVCLWKENSANIGNTMTEIYCNLIGLFLSAAESKNILCATTCKPSKRSKIFVPKLIASNDLCNKYYRFLLVYGKLAYATFFDDQRENSLAFDITSKDEIIDSKNIELGLQIGFLTEERHCKLLGNTFKLSFVHQTFQEFFAALYISSLEEEEGLLKLCFDKINKACKSLNDVLTVSHFYIFLSGICPKAAYTLSKDFGDTVRKDDYIHNFRRDMGSMNSFYCYNKSAKSLQDLVVLSVEESRVIHHDENVTVPIILEDIIIDEDFKLDSNYKQTLESLIRVNRNNIKSIKIREIKDTDAFKNILECLGGEELNPLVKIDCKCTFTPEDMDLLLHKSKNTLECFVIKGGEWRNDKWVHNYFSVPEKTCNLFQNLTNIEELYLRNIRMPHVQLEVLMQYIEGRESMKQIGLTFIKCDDHDKHQACVSLDLLRSDQLSVLELGELPLLVVKLNTQSLEACYIGEFYEQGVFATIMETVVDAKKLECFKCGFLREERNVAVLLETIPKLTRIKIIWLINLTLAQCSIELSRTMSRLESITLLKVLMQSLSVENIKTTLEELKQPVKVGIFSCGVSESEPEKFEEVKKSIKQSDKFRVLLDGIDENSHHEYMFESIGN